MRIPECSDVFAGRYRLDEKLGEGGMGIVFLATERNGGAVAVKIVKPDGAGYTAEAIRRFERESRILAELRSPYIVTLLDAGRSDDGLLYLVFEYIAGADLRDVLNRDGALPVDRVVAILTQLLTGLSAAHAAGLCHRDIKPENIAIAFGPDGAPQVKLLDFGIARPLSAGSSKVTRTGALMGTPRYMSPEALANAELTPATDVYSAGLVAIELLFGAAALPSTATATPVGTLLDTSSLPRPLQATLRRMTELDPRRRYPDAGAALRALQRASAEPRRTRPFRRAPGRTDRSGRSTMSSHRAAAALVVVGIVAAAVVYFRREDAQQTAPRPAVAAHRLTSDEAQAAALPSTDSPPPRGCGAPPRFTGSRREGWVRGLHRHEWTVRLPQGYDASHPHPLLLLFHQNYSSADEALAQSGFAAIADREKFVVVAVDDAAQPAWEGTEYVDVVTEAFERTRREICIDPGAVFLAGHGHGGFAAVRMSCLPWVSAVATAANLPRRSYEFTCDTPLPALHILPLNTEHVREEGGVGCGGRPYISHAEFVGLWRARNRADGEPTDHIRREDGTCLRYDGDAPFVSCRVAGGLGWPGTAPRGPALDFFGCDGESGTFPWAQTMWDFFASVKRDRAQ